MKIIPKNCQHRPDPHNCLLTAHRQVSPCTEAAVAAPSFMEEIAPYLKSAHAGIPPHLSCTQESWSQGTGWVTTTTRYQRELAALPGWKLRGLLQVGVGLCCGKELGSTFQVESTESGSQMAQDIEHGQSPMQAARNMAIGEGQLPEPNSAATSTFGLLMTPCQIKLKIPKSHRNTKCHIVFCLMCISP